MLKINHRPYAEAELTSETEDSVCKPALLSRTVMQDMAAVIAKAVIKKK